MINVNSIRCQLNGIINNMDIMTPYYEILIKQMCVYLLKELNKPSTIQYMKITHLNANKQKQSRVGLSYTSRFNRIGFHHVLSNKAEDA